jgi:hypothetical protein
MPHGMWMTKHYSKNYVGIRTESGDKFYTLDKGDITFIKNKDAKYYSPLTVHREEYRSLDRTLTKEIKAQLKPFFDYIEMIAPIAQPKRYSYQYQNAHILDYVGENPRYGAPEFIRGTPLETMTWQQFLTKSVDDDVPEHWFLVAEWCKYKFMREVYNQEKREYEKLPYNHSNMKASFRNAVYKKARPLAIEFVELGVKCFDKYRNW